MQQPLHPSSLAVLMRGARWRCPKCGTGKLFPSYLKQASRCSSCDEALGHLRADDGPAWLTIVVILHVLSPFLFIAADSAWPVWQIMALVMAITLAVTLAFLPCAKGMFLGLTWRLEQRCAN
jgi:uncharacterized protein (DUF983 family)